MSYENQIKRLTDYATEITTSNKLRKHLIHQYNLFVKKLLDEGRITKEELIPFFQNREKVAKTLNIEKPLVAPKVIPLQGGYNQWYQKDFIEKAKSEECLHENFNKHLVESGQCETIEEARKLPRHLHCPCKKCNPTY